jgi:hypothetical protein
MRSICILTLLLTFIIGTQIPTLYGIMNPTPPQTQFEQYLEHCEGLGGTYHYEDDVCKLLSMED